MNCKNCIHWGKCSKTNGKTRYYGETIASDNVEELCEWFISTVDVVPKSEVENYKQIAETQQKLSMDRYFEIKELKEDNERLKDDIEYLQDNVFKVRLEVAREIFEEIEKLHLHITNEFDVRRYTELKKKYTEDIE